MIRTDALFMKDLRNACRRFGVWCLILPFLVVFACAPKVADESINPDAYSEPVRVACVGDSLTHCEDCWPVHLRKQLDSRWDIGNFGVGGATVFKRSVVPYITEKLPEVAAYQPDVVVVFLGTNDSRLRYWYYKEEFEQNYHELINTVKAMPSKPRIWICLPPPTFPGQWGIDDGRLREMQPVIRRVARRHGIPVIDLYKPLAGRPERFPDQVHPDAIASSEFAGIIYRALVGSDPKSPAL